ncbi:hypothetical protein ASPWEDRAFT_173831 [Aspergillus wentii DTO 134E9]|uniref:Uncharacterized protein n=1 Tax=Aspergillus wentii DTO 134E9 TaxID=1073089 RepID=A0A1L9RHK0_ASPWE|nr:uncharacterized protein ASPWEDRAFT_173831 [Aspergillus wentii DTO 134E9]OJJ34416.1 hypothetical protein ASPWEDRAFT_173831 [Aspergillus wentii DTO 134E9]
MVYGQIARYMDDCKCCYGILTTYNQTICLRRETMFTFLASPVLYHSQSSASGPNGEVLEKPCYTWPIWQVTVKETHATH